MLYKTMLLVSIGALSALGTLDPGRASAQTTVRVPAARDATIFANDTNLASGIGAAIFAGTDGASNNKRGLLFFDLTGAGIPARAYITKASVWLTLARIAGGTPAPRTIRLYNLEEAWGEGPSGDPSVIEGQGSPAAPGDATWFHAFYPLKMWTEVPFTVRAELTIATPAVNTRYEWTSPELAYDVQAWVSGEPNYGWRLINADETSARTFLAFYSDEGAYHVPNLPSNAAPMLEVTYTEN